MQPQLRFDIPLVSAGPTLFAFVHILLSGIHTLATSADYVTQIYLFVNDTRTPALYMTNFINATQHLNVTCIAIPCF